MQAGEGESARLSRQAGWRLILAALVIAAAVILQASLQQKGLAWTSAVVVAVAALWGGWLLNAHARVPGLPLTIGSVMAATVLLTELIGTASAAVSGGTVFVALMLSAVAGSWAVGLVVAAILVAAGLVAVVL